MKNTGENEIQDITVSPKVTTGIKNWPFEIEKVSYERKVESLKANESVDVVFDVTPRQNVETKYYKVIFDVSYGDVTSEQSVFVKMEGKPEEPKEPGKNREKNRNKTRMAIKAEPAVRLIIIRCPGMMAELPFRTEVPEADQLKRQVH